MIEEFIEIYNWTVKIFIVNNDCNIDLILEELYLIGCNSLYASWAYENITSGNKNIGFTFSNNLLKKSIIFFGKHTSENQLINTIAHESRHLQQHISNCLNLDANGEEVCYLLGEIVQKIYEKFKQNCLL